MFDCVIETSMKNLKAFVRQINFIRVSLIVPIIKIFINGLKASIVLAAEMNPKPMIIHLSLKQDNQLRNIFEQQKLRLLNFAKRFQGDPSHKSSPTVGSVIERFMTVIQCWLHQQIRHRFTNQLFTNYSRHDDAFLLRHHRSRLDPNSGVVRHFLFSEFVASATRNP